MLQLPVETVVSDVDESVPEDWSPVQIVEELSLRKARSISDGLPAGSGSIVVGSDTIVVLDGQVLGKPVDEQDAWRILGMLEGRTHEVYSGVSCIALDAGESRMESEGDLGTPVPFRLGDTGQYRIISESANGQPAITVGHTSSQVTFRPMSKDEIGAYVKTGEPLDKAGAYGVQGLGSVFVERIEGDFYSIMGLPLNLLYQMLLRFGVHPFTK